MNRLLPSPRAALLACCLALGLSLAACDAGGSGDDDRTAQPNSVVEVAYVGTLQDSTIFDQSPRARFSLQRVLPGFREGVVGMRVDSTRTFDVPPEKGYGDSPPDSSGIPPNATLTFEVTLLDIL